MDIDPQFDPRDYMDEEPVSEFELWLLELGFKRTSSQGFDSDIPDMRVYEFKAKDGKIIRVQRVPSNDFLHTVYLCPGNVPVSYYSINSSAKVISAVLKVPMPNLTESEEDEFDLQHFLKLDLDRYLKDQGYKYEVQTRHYYRDYLVGPMVVRINLFDNRYMMDDTINAIITVYVKYSMKPIQTIMGSTIKSDKVIDYVNKVVGLLHSLRDFDWDDPELFKTHFLIKWKPLEEAEEDFDPWDYVTPDKGSGPFYAYVHGLKQKRVWLTPVGNPVFEPVPFNQEQVDSVAGKPNWIAVNWTTEPVQPVGESEDFDARDYLLADDPEIILKNMRFTGPVTDGEHSKWERYEGGSVLIVVDRYGSETDDKIDWFITGYTKDEAGKWATNHVMGWYPDEKQKTLREVVDEVDAYCRGVYESEDFDARDYILNAPGPENELARLGFPPGVEVSNLHKRWDKWDGVVRIVVDKVYRDQDKGEDSSEWFVLGLIPAERGWYTITTNKAESDQLGEVVDYVYKKCAPQNPNPRRVGEAEEDFDPRDYFLDQTSRMKLAIGDVVDELKRWYDSVEVFIAQGTAQASMAEWWELGTRYRLRCKRTRPLPKQYLPLGVPYHQRVTPKEFRDDLTKTIKTTMSQQHEMYVYELDIQGQVFRNVLIMFSVCPNDAVSKVSLQR